MKDFPCPMSGLIIKLYYLSQCVFGLGLTICPKKSDNDPGNRTGNENEYGKNDCSGSFPATIGTPC